MSHILDALQKVQDQKAAKLKQSTMTAGILLESPVHRSNGKHQYLFASVAVVILCAAALIIWSSIKSSKSESKEAIPAGTIQQPKAVALPLAPPLPPPVTAAPAQAVLPAPIPVTPPPRTAEKNSEQPANNPVIASAPEGVKLTGIAWQDNQRTRRAVINDTLVGEGAVIAGAKVIEIRPDMVRFEKNGAIFEVTLLR
jgi:general secretion pathway protein B